MIHAKKWQKERKQIKYFVLKSPGISSLLLLLEERVDEGGGEDGEDRGQLGGRGLSLSLGLGLGVTRLWNLIKMALAV